MLHILAVGETETYVQDEVGNVYWYRLGGQPTVVNPSEAGNAVGKQGFCTTDCEVDSWDAVMRFLSDHYVTLVRTQRALKGLDESGQPKPSPGEQIVIIAPSDYVQTWIVRTRKRISAHGLADGESDSIRRVTTIMRRNPVVFDNIEIQNELTALEAMLT